MGFSWGMYEGIFGGDMSAVVFGGISWCLVECPWGVVRGGCPWPVQDYKTLGVAVRILVTLVNTHTHMDSNTSCTINSARWAQNGKVAPDGVRH